MTTATATADAIASTPETPATTQREWTDWGHEEHDTSIPTDEATLSIGNRTDFYIDPPQKGENTSPYQDSTTNDWDGLYQRLRKHNRDIWWAYRDDVELSESLDNQYKRGVIASFSIRLGLSDLLTQRAFEWFMRLDLQRMGLQSEMVAFAICIRVVNEQAERYGDSGRAYDPQHSDVSKREDFRELQNDLIRRYQTVTRNKIMSTIGKLQQGNPPIRPESKWKHFVKNEAFTQLLPTSGGEAAPHE